MDAMTIKMDAHYKELQSYAKQITLDLDDDDIPMSRKEEAKFMQTFCKTYFYNDYRDRHLNHDNWHSSRWNDYYRSNTDDKSYDLQRQLNDFMKSQQSTNAFVKETFMDLKTQLETVAKNHQALIQNLETKFDRLADKQSGRPSRSVSSNTQPNPRDNNSKAYQPPTHKQQTQIRTNFCRFLTGESFAILQNKVPPKLGDPGSFLFPCNFNKTFSCNALADLGASTNLMSYSLYAKLSLETLKPIKMSVRLTNRSFQYPVGITKNMLVEVGKFTFPVDFVILETEEDSKVPLILGRPFLHTADATKEAKSSIPSKEPFSKMNLFEFDKFIAMVLNENYDSESDKEEPKFEKITINTDYKIKTSLEEPPTNLELKPLLDNLEYVFLEEPYIPGIYPSFCKYKIQLLDDKKPDIQKQRRLNPNMQEVVKKEIMKLLDNGIIYLIADSPWVSPIHCIPKKGGIIVVTNENDELVPARTVTGWRVCIDYRKLNEPTAKDHFPLSFMDQILERLAGNKYFCFLDGFSGYFQIPIDPMDQEKTAFTCPSEKCHFMVKEGIVLGHKVSGAGLEVDKAKINEMILASDGVASKPIKEKVMPIALKANVTRGQTSNDSVCQDGSDEDKDKDKDKEKEFNSIVRNLWKLFKKGNRFNRENRLGNGGDRFDRGHRSKGVGRSRGQHNCYGCGSKNHFVDDCPKAKL
nr:reverse transcriptase domain-containing protein [Tanacetum cinerariifolium]